MFVLGENIEKGQKIKVNIQGVGKVWRVVKDVTDKGARIKEGLIPFGSTILAWKEKE